MTRYPIVNCQELMAKFLIDDYGDDALAHTIPGSVLAANVGKILSSPNRSGTIAKIARAGKKRSPPRAASNLLEGRNKRV